MALLTFYVGAVESIWMTIAGASGDFVTQVSWATCETASCFVAPEFAGFCGGGVRFLGAWQRDKGS